MYVGDVDRTHVHAAAGHRQTTPQRRPAERDTVYDLASLTKVIATATAVMMLRDEGEIRLDQSIAEFVPIPAFRPMTLFHLLTHTAGLVPGKPYYKTATSLDEMFQRYAVEGIERPVGRMSVYSDVGFMLLGRMVEIVAGDSLDGFCERRIFKPLDMRKTAFRPPQEWWDNTAATERCPWRGRMVVGEVHDENAYAVGGVAGHAGLFSTAADLAKFLRALLKGEVLRESTLVEMTTMDKVPTYPWRGLAWLMDPWRGKQQGYMPGRRVFGHTGFTGTSIWADRDTGLFTILLSNTCHPSRTNRKSEELRRIVHTAVDKVFYPNRTSTHSGLDRVTREEFRAVAGRRIALLTNHAAVDQFGRHITEVIGLSNTRLELMYSPEHGIAGQAEAGERVGAQSGPARVISLYGEQKAPSAAELRDVDLFVIDLQDVGARYYTYMATMKRCLAACAKARKPVVVLDRPNPLGGEIIEGPIATITASDVCSAPIPIRHGMTMGELATLFAATELKGSGLQLAVNTLDNWEPKRLFDECALPWPPPSPNIPTAETALLYVGTCLFEGTNITEGRGTETPFHVIGAPWLDAAGLIDGLPRAALTGAQLEAVPFTPVAIPGKASNPRYRDETCEGVRIRVVDARAIRPFTVTYAILLEAYRRHRDKLAFSSFFDTLAGGPDLRGRLQRGEPAIDVVESYAAAARNYQATRPRLYPPYT